MLNIMVRTIDNGSPINIGSSMFIVYSLIIDEPIIFGAVLK